MNTITLYVGDVCDVMSQMIADGDRFDQLITSPPFWEQRDYLPADHEHKAREIGKEPSPAEFLDTQFELTELYGRLIPEWGSICVELGDTQAGSGGAGGDYNTNGLRAGQPKFRQGKTGTPLAKSACGIPQGYYLGLIYGRNPISGAKSPAGEWRARNWLVWARPNPPVGSLGKRNPTKRTGDYKFRPACSYITVACRGTGRYFDLDQVRLSNGTTTPNGTAGRASLGVSAVGREVSGTLHTADGPNVARWWCDLRFAQVAVNGAVARDAQGQQVVELVGLDVRLEASERPYVVDLQSVRGSTSLAGVQVAVECCLATLPPVRAAVVDAPTEECGAVLASPVGGTPDAIALETAEVVSVEGALVSGDRLAARLTLQIDGAITYAWFVAPIAPSHAYHPIKSDRSTHGAPPLDWHTDHLDGDWLWKLATAPYPGAHYATYPLTLPRRLILAMCPSAVCLVCGWPRERVVGETRYVDVPNRALRDKEIRMYGRINGMEHNDHRATDHDTLGFTDCGCAEYIAAEVANYPVGAVPKNNYRPGRVLDPFGGSGTTAVAAALEGRDCTLIDLDPRNVALVDRRLREALHVTGYQVDGNIHTWEVEAPLPAQQAQVDGQANLFDLEPVPPKPYVLNVDGGPRERDRQGRGRKAL